MGTDVLERRTHEMPDPSVLERQPAPSLLEIGANRRSAQKRICVNGVLQYFSMAGNGSTARMLHGLSVDRCDTMSTGM